MSTTFRHRANKHKNDKFGCFSAPTPLVWHQGILVPNPLMGNWQTKYGWKIVTITMKKALRETQTLRTGCRKAEPKIFAPLQTPFLGVWDGQNLISWRWSLPLPTNPVWWGLMHTISSYRGNRPTNKRSHKPTNRQDRLQYTALQLACSVITVIQTFTRRIMWTIIGLIWGIDSCQVVKSMVNGGECVNYVLIMLGHKLNVPTVYIHETTQYTKQLVE